MSKRVFLKAAASLVTLGFMGMAQAQSTPIKFQLDWRFEGPSALFLTPVAKGYFKDAKLDVTVDAGNGSGGAVTRVASGAYDMGFADLAALMEFHANNPDAPNKPVAVMMVYNNTPAAVLALKKSGITKPADLKGKKLGAPVFDAGRKGFPVFQKANGIGNVAWTSMDPPLRETMLVRGDIDAITGFTFTSLLNLEARGVKAADVVVLPYPAFGVKLYGNAIIASPKLIKEQPEVIKAFLTAFTKGAKDVMANPGAAIKRAHARTVLSYYEAAKPDRTRKGRRALGTANHEVMQAGATLRQTARHLEQNYDLALGVLNTLVANVVGPTGIGIEPQPRRADGSIDDALARQILALEQAALAHLHLAELDEVLVDEHVQDAGVGEVDQGGEEGGTGHGLFATRRQHGQGGRQDRAADTKTQGVDLGGPGDLLHSADGFDRSMDSSGLRQLTTKVRWPWLTA